MAVEGLVLAQDEADRLALNHPIADGGQVQGLLEQGAAIAPRGAYPEAAVADAPGQGGGGGRQSAARPR
jgi:hypothetical protein